MMTGLTGSYLAQTLLFSSNIEMLIDGKDF
jgi:hypothetical protein